MNTISFQSFNYPKMYIRHANWLAELTTVDNDQDRQDATFSWKTGLADQNLVSFAANRPNTHYLRHQDFRIKLQLWDQTFDPNNPGETPEQHLYRLDTTFVAIPGLADTSALSFRSINFPDRFLRHRDFHLYLEPPDSDLARQDATFRITPGFIPPPAPPH